MPDQAEGGFQVAGESAGVGVRDRRSRRLGSMPWRETSCCRRRWTEGSWMPAALMARRESGTAASTCDQRAMAVGESLARVLKEPKVMWPVVSKGGRET